jgi:FKBP-type peptidyl-prolyl cis-trans isomerase SlyD
LKITKNSVVTIQYILTDSKNAVLDQSSPSEPLVYLHGSGSIIPGLEAALEGKSRGNQLQVTVPPEEAYGVRHEEMLQSMKKSEFPEGEEVELGMRFQVQTENGTMILTVIEVKENEIIVDANHPLAGLTLNFDVKVEDVREATENEITHGHAHGPDDHHHH